MKRWMVRFHRLPRKHRIHWQDPTKTWRDWQGWYLVGWGILFLAGVGVVSVGHGQYGVSCVRTLGYVWILGSIIGLVVIVKVQRAHMRDLEQKLHSSRTYRSHRRKRG